MRKVSELRHGLPHAWPPPWDELDPGIREVVRALVDAGFRTIASCDGHPSSEHDARWPQVSVEYHVGEVARLNDWLREHGLAGCTVSVCRSVNRSAVGEPYLNIEWWTDQPIKDWNAANDHPAQEGDRG